MASFVPIFGDFLLWDDDDYGVYPYYHDGLYDMYDTYGSEMDLDSHDSSLSDSETTTKPVPSGYSYDFTSTPPEELTCPICLSVLRDANLTSCCGNHFCAACITLIKSDKKPCPLCKEKRFTLMLDKSICRKVKQLEVKCPNSTQGCEWVGELGSVDKHISDNQCDFVEVLCDFVGCGESFTRRSLTEHKSGICKKRPYTCEYCQLRDTWAVITQDHYPVCEKHPVPCPNECDIGEIERKELVQHILVCPLQVINCSFHFSGCKVSLPRHEMQQHVAENMASHLTLGFQTFQQLLSAKDDEIAKLKDTVTTLKAELSVISRKDILEDGNGMLQSDLHELREDVDELKEEIESVKSMNLLGLASNSKDDHRNYPPFHVTMTNFEQLRNSNAQWFSESFYTHRRGYKMCLSVFPNGTGIGSGSHVSVFVNIMRGDFDNILSWPFRGHVDVKLKLDNGNQYLGTLQFTDRSPAKASGRVESGDRQTFGQGASMFAPQISLGPLDKKYLNFEVTDTHVYS